MSITTSNTKAAALAHVQALIAGTTKHFPNGSFTIGSTTYTSASLVQVLQGLASAMLARNAAETGAKDALTAEQDDADADRPDCSGLRAPRPCCVRQRDPDAGGLRPHASQGANAVDRAAAGRPGGEGQGHAHCAWDDEQEAEARRQRRCDGSRRDPHHSADRGHASRTAGVDCFERARHGLRHEVVVPS